LRRFLAVAEKVLIVHEDAAVVARFKAALASVAPDIQVANALSAIRAEGMLAQEKPDVLVVDAGLADRDGYEFAKAVKAVPETSGVPIVMVAPVVDEVAALKARSSGAAALLPSAGADEQLATRIVSLARSGGAQAPPSAPGPAPQVMSVPAAVAAGGPVPAAPTSVPVSPGASASSPATAPAGPGGPPAGAPAGSGPSGTTPVGAVPSGPAPVAGYGAPTPVNTAPPTGSPAGAPSGPAPMGTGVPQPVKSAGPVVTGEGAAPGSGTPHIDDLLRLMLERGGSDLHITVGSPPGIRQRGEIVGVENMKPLSPRDTMDMLLGLLSEEQRRRFETELELDFAYSIPGVSRFRANVFQQRNSMGAVFRVIPIRIPTMDDLGLPKVCRYLAERPRGLVLVTGPTGSGKSTTLAAMVDYINTNRAVHIITMEDPIEFMHRNKKAYVNQREVGEDTHSFAAALKRVLRQDPDVILVGEMRDLETISAAITAAETGHLVLATLHTTGGPETVDRVIDVFPPHQQQQVRMQLSNTLEGVLSQVLMRSTDGRSRIMAMEIMLGVPAISNLIREGKTHQMETIIQGSAALGMQTLDQHLKNLLTQGKVTFDEAISKAKSPRELAAMMGRKI
jgi:twitching motility protein PilT